MKIIIEIQHFYKLLVVTKGLVSIIIIMFIFQYHQAQDLMMEVGFGIGKVTNKQQNLGKGEIHINVLKNFKFGQIGLDFSTGGNFIPGSTNLTTQGNTEILSANDSKFSAITMLYRLPIRKHLFVEPRLGLASLYSFVHTNDRTRIEQTNFTAGLALGGRLNQFIFSLRYQYFGKTTNYEGFRDTTKVTSNSAPLGVILFRVSYGFRLDF